MTTQNEQEEMMQDAEEELAQLKQSAAQRPTRAQVAPAPISGQNSDASQTNVAGGTRLATTQGGSLTQPRDGSRQITSEDRRIPSLKISQSLSGVVSEDNMKVGQWYYTLDNSELGPKIRVVAVDLYKSRSYMIKGVGLSCRSSDMFIGIGDPGGDCETCELKNWPPKGTKGGPPCRVTYNFPVAIIPEDYEEGMMLDLALIRLNGSNAAAAQDMIGIHDSKGLPWHQIMWDLNAVKAPFGTASFYKAVARLSNRTGKVPEAALPELEKYAILAGTGAITPADEGDEES